MSEMIERVARALADSDGAQFHHNPNVYMVLARAALEAMREPTKGMLDEACRTAPHVIFTYTKPEERGGAIPLVPVATWRAMIAAALQEKEHP